MGALALALGFQIHFSLNSPAQYLRFSRQDDLRYLAPFVLWCAGAAVFIALARTAPRQQARQTG